MGSCLLLKQLSDLSFELKDYKPKVENSSPASIIDRILEKLRTVYPETRSRIDLNADPLIGGNVTAIRKSLERLVDRGLIQIWEQKPSVNGGRPTNYYKAILVRGDKKSVALNGKPSDNNDLAMRQVNKKKAVTLVRTKQCDRKRKKISVALINPCHNRNLLPMRQVIYIPPCEEMIKTHGRHGNERYKSNYLLF